MKKSNSNIFAQLIGVTFALALPFAAVAQESDASKAPVHHMSPPVGGSTVSTQAPAVITEGSDAMVKRDSKAAKAPVHHQDPSAQ